MFAAQKHRMRGDVFVLPLIFTFGGAAVFKPMGLLIGMVCVLSAFSLFAEEAELWEKAYTGEDASGDHVIAFWNGSCEGDEIVDVSGNGHHGRLEGAVLDRDGRFGEGFASFAGWPVDDSRHAIEVKRSDALSPRGAFTIEMWLCPDESFLGYGESFLIDKKYVAHTDYQWMIEQPDEEGNAIMRVNLGFGEDSALWRSQEAAQFKPGQWSHVAFSYDGAGQVRFFQNGRCVGTSVKSGRGAVYPGDHLLSIGDRLGSYYHGFPGRLDEIRISEGALEFSPVRVTAAYLRSAYERGESIAPLAFTIKNLRSAALTDLNIKAQIAQAGGAVSEKVSLAPGEEHNLSYPLDSSLRPDTYTLVVSCQLGDDDSWVDNTEFPVTIVGRKAPHRMPVVMWGVGGVSEVLDNLQRLKEIGFTHCLGLRCPFDTVWEAEAPVRLYDDEEMVPIAAMLDEALVNDLGIVISVGVGHWLENKEELLRIDRDGKGYDRQNICCNFPKLEPFAKNVGLSITESYHDFPAFQGALINTEVRDGSQLCFHEHDRALYRAAAGVDIPDAAVSKNGVSYTNVENFPEDRVVADDDELLRFYRWFWRDGDGWNKIHSAVHGGLKEGARQGFWTFFDPAVRVPPLWGSGGTVDYLSHWTYSYPDPIRIGLCADELFAMAKGGVPGQDVMKMTQIIWYRSQTAPMDDKATDSTGTAASPWEDYDPDAAYITIAPTHLKEAFWTKISRPVKGIMYHGWQSLVPVEGKSAYRFTHPETQKALKELVDTVVTPLGPTLTQLPGAPADVAFLESFSSTIFASRGTYGWGGSWAGDAYHILLYAGLQPEIIYEETILRDGLDGFKVLVLADCDVLPRAVVERIQAFQGAGGLIVGDERLCPALHADLNLTLRPRSKKADKDKAALLRQAKTLQEALQGAYEPYLRSSEAEVLPYHRRYGDADYIFAINDHREFGSYVGHHGMVMENGLPLDAVFSIDRGPAAQVYDLVAHEPVATSHDGERLQLPVALEPGGGGIWMVSEKAIAGIHIEGAEGVKRLEELRITVSVVDDNHTALAAIVPVEILIKDPDGRQAEWSGFYGAKEEGVEINLALAPNDTLGLWTVYVKELASGKKARHYFRVVE